MVSGVRQGRVDVKSPPIALMFSRDGSLLVVATAVGTGGCLSRAIGGREKLHVSLQSAAVP